MAGKFSNEERVGFDEIELVVAARKAAKISQTDAGKVVGVTRQTMYNWEHMKMGTATMPRDVFNALMDYYASYESTSTHGTMYIADCDRIDEQQTIEIANARVRAGVSQQDAGKQVGVDGNTISRWENPSYYIPNMPKDAYATLLDYYKHPNPEGKVQRRRVADKFRITDEEQEKLTHARKIAKVTAKEAGKFILRTNSVILNWEDPSRANAPRDDYEELMVFYKTRMPGYGEARVTEVQRREMIDARFRAICPYDEAELQTGYDAEQIEDWEDIATPNAPIEAYEALMACYKEMGA